MVMDGLKAQTLGKFCQKLQDACCEKKTREPYSPWKNAAKRKIKDLMKGAGRKLLLTNTPPRLWDNCLVYEAYVRSHTTHDIFKLDGEVPKTIISGKTADISQFCKLYCYKWVQFCSTTVSFPEGLLVLGTYLGPSIDIGSTMIAKILTPTGKVVRRSTFRLLEPEELADPVKQDLTKAFLWTAEEQWGNRLIQGQLEEVGLIDTPDPQPNLDNQ